MVPLAPALLVRTQEPGPERVLCLRPDIDSCCCGVCSNNPSITDVENQSKYQSLYQDGKKKPFVGAIICACTFLPLLPARSVPCSSIAFVD
jgi:hypothetical protein